MPCFQLGHFCCFTDGSALLKQREKILDKKNKVSTASSSPPPVPDANFLNNILNASAAIKARADKRPFSAGSCITGSAQAANSFTMEHAAVKKSLAKVETSQANIGLCKTINKVNKPKDFSEDTNLMQSNIDKINANISHNKAFSSVSKINKTSANFSSTSKGFATVGNKEDLNKISNISKDYSVISSDPEFNSLSSQSAKFTTYSNSPENSIYNNIDQSTYIRSPIYNNKAEELSMSKAANTNLDNIPKCKTIQYSNIKSESQATYGNVQESGRWITNLKKKGILLFLVLSFTFL